MPKHTASVCTGTRCSLQSDTGTTPQWDLVWWFQGIWNTRPVHHRPFQQGTRHNGPPLPAAQWDRMTLLRWDHLDRAPMARIAGTPCRSALSSLRTRACRHSRRRLAQAALSLSCRIDGNSTHAPSSSLEYIHFCICILTQFGQVQCGCRAGTQQDQSLRIVGRHTKLHNYCGPCWDGTRYPRGKNGRPMCLAQKPTQTGQ